MGCLQHTTTSMTTTRTQGSKDVEGDGDASHIQLLERSLKPNSHQHALLAPVFHLPIRHASQFLVDYNVNNYADVPRGWTDIDALTVPFTFDYNNPTFSR